MSESCDSKCQFSSLVISDLILLCSFILSHPLYFSYLVFFSPYLLKLISFLSPLFITTFLLFLAFLVHTESSQTRLTPILERLQFKKECPNEDDDDLKIYEIVFGPPSMAAAVREENVNDPSEFSAGKPEKDQNLFLGSNKEEPKVENKTPCVVMEEKRLENFLKILDEFERLASNVEEIEKKKKKLEPSRCAKSDKVVEKQKSLLRNGSDACNNNNKSIDSDDSNVGNSKEFSPMAKSHSQRIVDVDHDDGNSKMGLKAESCRELDGGGGNLSSYGSMRREREWKRTLACKLFEERHNAAAGGGGEGMDSLWEAYEMDSRKGGGSEKVKREKVKREKVKREEDHEEEIGSGQLCCLQALKLSAGKMNLGVGRPNLVKISKAIKGIGWLHKITKNSKKVHSY
ncbi:hypothetical protein C2S53_010714 [Perilla frutescens var. hirtella]|uniref:Uncharacterized protein n=1 Tax=Perilla frutescens var. hirtella TaxID=608512 RepID=A0AAD4P2M5_PERFH|nr:hypothetical protein C2S53_010714 [Perilla frutescens var. hirtella]